MYHITVNDSAPFRVERKKEQLLLNDQSVDWSCEKLPDGSFSILSEGRSYRGELLETDAATGEMTLRVDGQICLVRITGPLDQLLASMGLEERKTRKLNQIKAPMPGLILKILVSEGQSVAKGDPVLILEAMKMENVFKAPGDVHVKEIRVTEHTAVEKGQVLLVLE